MPKIPVFLGSDPFGGSDGSIIGVAEYEDEGDILITIKAVKIKTHVDKLIDLNQIKGLALNVAFLVPEVKKED